MKRCCSKQCSFVAASARLARPSSSRVRIVQSIGNALTLLSALNAFRMMSRTNIDRIRAEEFSSKHKRRSHDSFTAKEYKSVRRCRSLLSCCCCVAESCSCLFHVRVKVFSKRGI